MLISIKGKKGNLQFIIDEKEELPCFLYLIQILGFNQIRWGVLRAL